MPFNEKSDNSIANENFVQWTIAFEEAGRNVFLVKSHTWFLLRENVYGIIYKQESICCINSKQCNIIMNTVLLSICCSHIFWLKTFIVQLCLNKRQERTAYFEYENKHYYSYYLTMNNQVANIQFFFTRSMSSLHLHSQGQL